MTKHFLLIWMETNKSSKCFIMTGDKLQYIVGIMNSKLISWWFTDAELQKLQRLSGYVIDQPFLLKKLMMNNPL
jgi:cAMP phosphodiesterase